MKFALCRTLHVTLCVSVLGACQGSDPAASAAPGSETGSRGDGGVGAWEGADAQVGVGPGGSGTTGGQAADPNGCKAQNFANLSEAQVRALAQGGAANALRFLYPYDGTVFPRGLAAPVLMWEGDGAPADAVYLHLHSKAFRYQACLKPDAAGRLSLPQEVWNRAAAGSTGKSDPFQIELTLLHGNLVAGPIREQLIIAPGSLKGSVYYNSYSSARARKGGATGGAVLRIPAGGEAELFIGQRGCAGCHGASADGSRLVTNEGVYALTPNTPVNPPALRSALTEFVGLTPDGKAYAFQGQLYDTDSGRTLSANLPTSANEVSFSPDGHWATFIDGFVNTRGNPAGVVGTIPGLGSIPGLSGIPGLGSIPGVGGTGQNKLAVMRFDATARTLSEYRAFSVSAGAQWPLFLPDSKGIVFADTNTNDLMLLDVASGQVTLLARAMGFRTPEDAKNSASYLPFAAQGEARQAFFPTLSPVAAGGYFWVYFDSPRRYGNFDTAKIESGLTAPAGIDLSSILPVNIAGLVPASKQLWVSAIEIAPDGRYVEDRSAPAFYLPGQEMGANNHRAFSALDPCLGEGQRCDSGTKCCSGFCAANACVPPPTDRCAQTEEACRKESDCCNAGDQCINGYCSVILL